jgi:hypothetical protein
MGLRGDIARPNLLWRGFVLGGLAATVAVSVSDEAWDWWREHVTDAVPRDAYRGLLGATVVVHVLEAAATRRVARRAGLDHRGARVRSTFLYGYPAHLVTKRAAALEG